VGLYYCMFSHITAKHLFYIQERAVECIRKDARIIGVPDLVFFVFVLADGRRLNYLFPIKF
jgi:hypothetical protein